MTIEITHELINQRFTTTVEGQLCVLNYVLRNQIATFTHTGVPDAAAGRGVAAALTKFALETARREAWKVVPACSYVDAYLRKHPEYADLTRSAI